MIQKSKIESKFLNSFQDNGRKVRYPIEEENTNKILNDSLIEWKVS